MAAPHQRADADPVGRARQGDPGGLWFGVARSDPGRAARGHRAVRTPPAGRAHGGVDRQDHRLRSGSRGMKFFCFHLMPYAALDPDYDKTHNSAWVTLPNSYYDPKIGHALYNRYLDELEFADSVGFDG